MNGTGRAADSSAGYVLPNGAIRSPDASWVSNERLASLSTDEKSRFLPMCPDFVIELRSATDPLPPLRAKMSEYIASGAVLGWLIDPANRQVVVYRPELAAEELDSATSVSGDPELAGVPTVAGGTVGGSLSSLSFPLPMPWRHLSAPVRAVALVVGSLAGVCPTSGCLGFCLGVGVERLRYAGAASSMKRRM